MHLSMEPLFAAALLFCSSICGAAPQGPGEPSFDERASKLRAVSVAEAIGPLARSLAPQLVRFAEEHPRERLAVLRALAEIGAGGSISFLLACARDEDEATRVLAAQLLAAADVHHEAAVEAVLPTIDSWGNEHSERGRLDRRISGLLVDDVNVEGGALETLVMLGPRGALAVPMILDVLERGERCWGLAFCLGAMGTASLPAQAKLATLLDQAPFRSNELDLLMLQIGDASYLPTAALVGQLWEQPDPDLDDWRRRIEQGQSHTGEDYLVQFLGKRILHAPSLVPPAVWEVLGELPIDCDRVLPELDAVFFRGDASERAAALKLHLEWKARYQPPWVDDAALELLYYAAEDPSAKVRSVARDGARALGISYPLLYPAELIAVSDSRIERALDVLQRRWPKELTCGTGYDFTPFLAARMEVRSLGAPAARYIARRIDLVDRERADVMLLALSILGPQAAEAAPALLGSLEGWQDLETEVVFALASMRRGVLEHLRRTLEA